MNEEQKLTLPDDLPPTVKVFHDDPYLKTAAATVLWVSGPHVVTDKTIFYAESGGQESDKGLVGGLNVVALGKQKGRRLVVERKDVEVPAVTVDTTFVHTLDRDAPFKVGDNVPMEIDWARRYDLMRHHSAAHILYWASHQVYDKEGDLLFTKGCSIRPSSARLDFFGALDGGEALLKAEGLTNDLIAENAPILMEAEPLTKDIYYWRCKDILIPCGGTHVRATGELAPIKVKREKKGQTTTRFSFTFAA
jgi:alanyl-tRNA synthetase